MKIRRAFEEKGYPFLVDSYTNQQFPILPDDKMNQLMQSYAFAFWQRVDEGHCAVRFCTSWATSESDVDALIADIKGL